VHQVGNYYIVVICWIRVYTGYRCLTNIYENSDNYSWSSVWWKILHEQRW